MQKNVLTKGELAKAVFFAGKGRWAESNQFFKDQIGSFKSDQVRGDEVRGRLFYAWALEREGRLEEAKVQLEGVQKLYRDTEERFAHVSLQASLMVCREVNVGEEFEMRLDLVNASRRPGLLVKAEGVIPSDGFKVIALPPDFSLQNDCIEMKNREIGAFQVVAVKLMLRAVKTGVFALKPKIVYLDELGQTKTNRLKTRKISVEPVSPKPNEEKAIATTFS